MALTQEIFDSTEDVWLTIILFGEPINIPPPAFGQVNFCHGMQNISQIFKIKLTVLPKTLHGKGQRFFR